jgi:hypothetical protein
MYADPFDIEAQKKIEAAIRQVSFFFLRINMHCFWCCFFSMSRIHGGKWHECPK